jgi:hypothetical protein
VENRRSSHLDLQRPVTRQRFAFRRQHRARTRRGQIKRLLKSGEQVSRSYRRSADVRDSRKSEWRHRDSGSAVGRKDLRREKKRSGFLCSVREAFRTVVEQTHAGRCGEDDRGLRSGHRAGHCSRRKSPTPVSSFRATRVSRPFATSARYRSPLRPSLQKLKHGGGEKRNLSATPRKCKILQFCPLGTWLLLESSFSRMVIGSGILPLIMRGSLVRDRRAVPVAPALPPAGLRQ